MQYLKSFGVAQTAKMMAALYFLVAAVFAVVTIPLLLAFQPDYGPLGRAGVVVLLLCAPVLYAAVSFVMTAIICSIYNVVASRIGGIAFTLEPPVRSGSTLPG